MKNEEKEMKKKNLKKIKQLGAKIEQDSQEVFLQETLRLYTVLLSTFSSREHLIVGRDKEEKSIKESLEKGLKGKSQFLYICGRPGQGKTAVLDQVLNDHFSSETIIVFKFNAMRFKDLNQFIQNFMNEVELMGSKLNIVSKRRRDDDTVTEMFDDVTVEELTHRLLRQLQLTFNLKIATNTKKSKLKQDFQFIIVIDEIDHFSMNHGKNIKFKSFLQIMIEDQLATKVKDFNIKAKGNNNFFVVKIPRTHFTIVSFFVSENNSQVVKFPDAAILNLKNTLMISFEI